MDQIPEKYKEKCVAVKRILIKNKITTLILTENSEIIEVRNKQIINYTSLKTLLSDNSVRCVTKNNCSVKVHHQYGDCPLLVFLKIENILVILALKAEINVVRVYKNVSDYNIAAQNSDALEKSFVKINFNNGDEENISSFSDFPNQTKELTQTFRSVENQLKTQKQKVAKSLESIRNRQLSKVRSLIGDQKLLPRLMRLNDVVDMSPLIRFGSIFTRVCNEKMVIGIPIYNACSLERPVEVVRHVPVEVIKHVPVEVYKPVRVLLENLKLIASCPSILNVHFRYDLFKMNTECPNFEEFEELFDNEKHSRHDVPEFNQEWSKGSTVLYASEAGVFVLTVDIVQFINVINHEIVFNISYEIIDEVRTEKILLNIGEVHLNASSIFSKDLEIISWNSEKYRNLLAITSTADSIVDLEITFESVNCDIENFLQNKLHFDIIKSNKKIRSSDVLLSLRSDYFLYCSTGYFQGVLMRLNLQNDLLMKAKIYVRAIHQLIMLTQSIYGEFSDNCTIELKQFYGHAKAD